MVVLPTWRGPVTIKTGKVRLARSTTISRCRLIYNGTLLAFRSIKRSILFYPSCCALSIVQGATICSFFNCLERRLFYEMPVEIRMGEASPCLIPQGKGIMGQWARLASRAAFRNGQSAPIIRAYLSPCWNCKNVTYDCWTKYIPKTLRTSNTNIKNKGRIDS